MGELHSLRFTVNGRLRQLMVEPGASLVDVLRDGLGLTGTKVNCRLGECGSCTILLDGLNVPSCLTFALHAAGREVVTIEGLVEDGRLHPLQQSFVEHHALQCGFCTPGMILSAKALLDSNPTPTRDEIQRALAGNLCRCTGYEQIIEAVIAASGLLQTGPEKKTQAMQTN